MIIINFFSGVDEAELNKGNIDKIAEVLKLSEKEKSELTEMAEMGGRWNIKEILLFFQVEVFKNFHSTLVTFQLC